VKDSNILLLLLADCRKQCIVKEAALFKAEEQCKHLQQRLDLERSTHHEANRLKVCHTFPCSHLKRGM
jgi:hypothetical protein